MTINRNLIAVVLLVLFATALLVSALDYSVDIIGSGGGPAGSYSYSGNPDTSMNHTLGNMSKGGGHPPEDGVNVTDPFMGLFFSDPGNGSSSADVRDSGNTLLILGLIAAAMAVVAFVAFIIIRRRRRRNASGMSARPTAPVLPAPVPDLYEGLFQLHFPQIRAPFPLTWGADEPLELVITCQDEETGESLLSVDGGEARMVLLENGTATISLKLEKGHHKISVSAIAGDDSWANVRIVDYREEIVRIFNDMCKRFMGAVQDGDDLTPREIERSAGAQMPETKRTWLNDAVTVFELANYSVHQIRRADFERMYRAEMGVT
jgi:hypothetical protein